MRCLGLQRARSGLDGCLRSGQGASAAQENVSAVRRRARARQPTPRQAPLGAAEAQHCRPAHAATLGAALAVARASARLLIQQGLALHAGAVSALLQSNACAGMSKANACAGVCKANDSVHGGRWQLAGGRQGQRQLGLWVNMVSMCERRAGVHHRRIKTGVALASARAPVLAAVPTPPRRRPPLGLVLGRLCVELPLMRLLGQEGLPLCPTTAAAAAVDAARASAAGATLPLEATWGAPA